LFLGIWLTLMMFKYTCNFLAYYNVTYIWKVNLQLCSYGKLFYKQTRSSAHSYHISRSYRAHLVRVRVNFFFYLKFYFSLPAAALSEHTNKYICNRIWLKLLPLRLENSSHCDQKTPPTMIRKLLPLWSENSSHCDPPTVITKLLPLWPSPTPSLTQPICDIAECFSFWLGLRSRRPSHPPLPLLLAASHTHKDCAADCEQ